MCRPGVVVLALACVLAPAMGRAQQVPAEIDALYKAFVKAYDAKNVKAVMALTTPDLTLRQRSMTLNARQTREMLEATFANPSRVSTTYKILSCQVRGSTAVCKVSMTTKGRMADADGKLRSIQATSVSNDTLVKTTGGWRIKASDTLSETMLVDGKPLAASPGPPPAAPNRPRR